MKKRPLRKVHFLKQALLEKADLAQTKNLLVIAIEEQVQTQLHEPVKDLLKNQALVQDKELAKAEHLEHLITQKGQATELMATPLSQTTDHIALTATNQETGLPKKLKMATLQVLSLTKKTTLAQATNLLEVMVLKASRLVAKELVATTLHETSLAQ